MSSASTEPGEPRMRPVSCAIVRGGTSKGVFLLEEHLPPDPGQRDRLLLNLMGSPDPRQIDGLGGADPLTSKVAIVARSSREGIDVEYESLEIGIAEAQVNHGLMCGNLIAGVGYFAMAEGLIAPRAPETTINIFCRSNRKTITARIPVDHLPLPGTDGQTPVGLRFANPGGAITGELLPTGEALSRFALDPFRELAVSIVDAGTLYAFVRADALGLRGNESAATLDCLAEFRSTVERLRQRVAERINQRHATALAAIAPRLVKVAIIAPPEPGEAVDIVARVINTAKVHKAYAVSGGICLAAAAAIPGSLVNAIVAPGGSPFSLRIGHPSGILSLSTFWSATHEGIHIEAAEIQRSARLILRGTTWVALPDETVAQGVATVPHVVSVPCLESVE